jgi:hypothetical protein
MLIPPPGVMAILSHVGEKGKFGIGVNAQLVEPYRAALEWLLDNDWVRLIDVTTVPSTPNVVFRIFKVSEEALTWIKSQSS